MMRKNPSSIVPRAQFLSMGPHAAPNPSAPRATHWLVACLLATGLGAVVLACEAKVETVCLDGPCLPTSSGATGGAGGSVAGGAAGAGGVAGSGGGDMCSDEPATGDLPCDVFAVLEAKCHKCHNAEHVGGAPIDLFNCDRFREKECGQTKPRFRVAQGFVDSGYMPFGGDMNKLTESEKATLLGWLDTCAPCLPAGTGCSLPPGAKACGP